MVNTLSPPTAGLSQQTALQLCNHAGEPPRASPALWPGKQTQLKPKLLLTANKGSRKAPSAQSRTGDSLSFSHICQISFLFFHVSQLQWLSGWGWLGLVLRIKPMASCRAGRQASILLPAISPASMFYLTDFPGNVYCLYTYTLHTKITYFLYT